MSGRACWRTICRWGSANGWPWPAPCCTNRLCSFSTSRPPASIPWPGGALWELIGRLSREQGVTILVSTHYMDEAEHCDRLALMHRGALVAVDSPTRLRGLAAERRGVVLEVAAPRFRDVIAALEPRYPDLSLAGSRIHVFTHDPAADRRQIADVLHRDGVGPATIREVQMAMDDVFATLISGRGER